MVEGKNGRWKKPKEIIIIWRVNFRRLLIFLGVFMLIGFNFWADLIRIIWLDKLLMLFKATSICQTDWRFRYLDPLWFQSMFGWVFYKKKKKQWGEKERGLFIFRPFFPRPFFPGHFCPIPLYTYILSQKWDSVRISTASQWDKNLNKNQPSTWRKKLSIKQSGNFFVDIWNEFVNFSEYIQVF